jgi:hypothetical protein
MNLKLKKFNLFSIIKQMVKKKCIQEKVKVVMKEFKNKKLKSGSGKRVKNPKQAIAIALNVAKKSCK